MPFSSSFSTETGTVHSTLQWKEPETHRRTSRFLILLPLLLVLVSCIGLMTIRIEDGKDIVVETPQGSKLYKYCCDINSSITTTDDGTETEHTETSTLVAATDTLRPTEKDIIVEDTTDGADDVIVCETTQCFGLSEQVNTLRETASDPCVDFYAYACGGDSNQEGERMKREKYTGKVLKELITGNIPTFEHVTDFYDKCVQYYKDKNKSERTDVVREVFLGLESYDWRDYDYDDLEATFYNLIHKLLLMDALPMFDVSLDVSASNSSRFDVTLMPHHTIVRELLTPYDPYCQQEIEEDLTHTYNQTMSCAHTATWTASDTVEEIPEAVYGYLTPMQKQYIEKGLFVLEHFLEMIEEELPDLASRKHKLIEKMYVEKTVRDLEMETDYLYYYDEDCASGMGMVFRWGDILKLLFGEQITEETKLQMYMPDYFEKIVQYVCKKDIDDFLQALRLTAAIKLYFEFVLDPAWESTEGFCIEKTKNVLQDAVSAMYMQRIQETHVDETMDKIEEMFSLLKEVMISDAREHLTVSDNVVLKLENAKIALKGSLPKFSFDKEFQKINWNAPYPQLALDLRTRLKEKTYDLYNKPTTSEDSLWFFHQVPYNSHDSSSYALNSVYFPPGLAKDSSLLNIPDALLWAWDGQALAHALMHLFDPDGLKGIVPDDKMDVACLYEKLGKTKEFKHLNRSWTFQPPADLVLNDLFSDIGALDITFKLFQSSNDSNIVLPDIHLTPTQLYFVAFAQWHCAPVDLQKLGRTIGHSEHLPPAVRVNELVKDSEIFNAAFQCKSNEETTTSGSVEANNETKRRQQMPANNTNPQSEEECRGFPYFIN